MLVRGLRFALMRKFFWPAAAMLCSCVTSTHILSTGALEQAVYLMAKDVVIGVEFVQSGTCWKNVWMDIIVSPKSAEETILDPMDFSLRDSPTGLLIKHTGRKFESSHCSGCGCREPQEWGFGGKGARVPTPAVLVKSGKIVRATLMFETGPDEAKFLKEFDLVYKGRTLHFGSIQHVPPKLSPPEDAD